MNSLWPLQMNPSANAWPLLKEVFFNQPIRLPGLKPGVCSGLILSGAFPSTLLGMVSPFDKLRALSLSRGLSNHYPDLKIGVWRRRTYQSFMMETLHSNDGHSCWVKARKPVWCEVKRLRLNILDQRHNPFTKRAS